MTTEQDTDFTALLRDEQYDERAKPVPEVEAE